MSKQCAQSVPIMWLLSVSSVVLYKALKQFVYDNVYQGLKHVVQVKSSSHRPCEAVKGNVSGLRGFT